MMGHSGRPGMMGGGGGMYGSSAGGKPSMDTRSGPRIFVGKLNKETSENDVKARAPSLHAWLAVADMQRRQEKSRGLVRPCGLQHCFGGAQLPGLACFRCCCSPCQVPAFCWGCFLHTASAGSLKQVQEA